MVSKLKRLLTEWEKVYISQGTDNQNTQGAQKIKLPPKINDPIKK
jgi:hypothetical protein